MLHRAQVDFGTRVPIYWLIVLALLATPFLYNPHSFSFRALLADLHLWEEWVSPRGVGGDAGQRWAAWWARTTHEGEKYDSAAMLGQVRLLPLLPLRRLLPLLSTATTTSTQWGRSVY